MFNITNIYDNKLFTILSKDKLDDMISTCLFFIQGPHDNDINKSNEYQGRESTQVDESVQCVISR